MSPLFRLGIQTAIDRGDITAAEINAHQKESLKGAGGRITLFGSGADFIERGVGGTDDRRDSILGREPRGPPAASTTAVSGALGDSKTRLSRKLRRGRTGNVRAGQLGPLSPSSVSRPRATGIKDTLG